jgi:hypothetical protein
MHMHDASKKKVKLRIISIGRCVIDDVSGF